MKKTAVKIICGIIVLAIGVALLGSLFGFWSFDLFFKGWWAVLIMIASIFFMISDRPNVINVFLLLFGGAAFLKERGIIPETTSLWLIALGIIIVTFGIKLIISAVGTSKAPTVKVEDGRATSAGGNAAFTEKTVDLSGLEFSTASYEVSFGSLTIDLSSSTFAPNAKLDVICSFGKVTILVSKDTTVGIADNDAAFGAVKNEAKASDSPVLTVSASVSFGSIEILTK